MTTKPSTKDGPGLNWFKSSYSTADGPSCVEAAVTPGTVHIRDSKDIHLPHLGFTPGSWGDFVTYATKN
ncbi:DUF397 domain-containing protein [Streptomyces sp. NPDC091212]|uniref:DUF397 domain-containing protein n=1 Tax=Streptomyces sp. NPDC091212 TaxID=3155191 RepID=UPI003441F568